MTFDKYSGYFGVNSYSCWITSDHFSCYGSALIETLIFDKKLVIAHHYLSDSFREIYDFKPSLFLIDRQAFFSWIGTNQNTYFTLSDFVVDIQSVSAFYPHLMGALSKSASFSQSFEGIEYDFFPNKVVLRNSHQGEQHYKLVLDGGNTEGLTGFIAETEFMKNIFGFKVVSRRINININNLGHLKLNDTRNEWKNLVSSGLLLENLCEHVLPPKLTS